MTITTQPFGIEGSSMKAITYEGPDNLSISSHPLPGITDPSDVIVRITTSTICGSDLHLFHGAIPQTKKGDILGHEGVGVIVQVGPLVRELSIGDRVVVSAVVADGFCPFCSQGKFSLCEGSNPSPKVEENVGFRTAGLFGYSHLNGGYPGLQAEFVRVPWADVNCLKLPDSVSDEKAVFLSDVACTAWHANELGMVGEGSNVAIWGAGPIGLMAAHLAQIRKAKTIVVIDSIDYRLSLARSQLNVETINFSTSPVSKMLSSIFPSGPDVAIDAVGFRYAASWKHYLEKKMFLETDAIDSLTEAILSVKKGGRVVAIGDYLGYANHFPIGPLMEKSLTLKGGQVFVQAYWKKLLELMVSGMLDPSFLVTHKLPLGQGVAAYSMFDKKEQNALKILLKCELSRS